MDEPKLNVYKINYTLEDRKELLKQHILKQWVEREHPDILEKIDQYVEDCWVEEE